MGGKEIVAGSQSIPERGDLHNRGEDKLEAQLTSPALDDDNPGAQTFRGRPITISQCTFQAHIARVRTEAEVRAVSMAVSRTTQHEAGFSDFVEPFAYRLACAGHDGAQRSPRKIGDGNRGPEGDTDSEEGYCDNGDVGSGEKLLHLLQKWDIRNRLLMVTRIDGGFIMAELMGVRRYKFVVDRAKKLLESTDLATLRRAVDTDVHPPTTAHTTNTNLADNAQAIAGTHGSGGPTGGAGWDRFVVPISARRRISGHTANGDLLRAPGASGGALVPPPRNKLDTGAGRGSKLRAKNATLPGVDASGAGSTRTRARRVLSLGQLSISSTTVPFPRGHVPSVMGGKGHGKKRGRINHFAVRTPPPDSWGQDGDDTGSGGGGGGGRYAGDIADRFDDGPRAGSPSADEARGRHALPSGWSIPHGLDPASPVTGGVDKTGEGSSSSTTNFSSSFHTASRVSTCDTINCPSRVAAIVLGVTGVHTALPPPCTNSSDGDGSSTSGGFSRLETASSPDDIVDPDGSSFVDSQQRPALPGTSPSGGCSAEKNATSRAGGVFQHRLKGGGGGGMAVLDGGCSLPGTRAAGHAVTSFPGVDRCVLPSTGGARGVAEGSGATRPLLHRTPGSGVRDEPPPSLVVVSIDEGARGGGGGSAPLSNGSTVGRWKSDNDDGCSTTSSAAGGGRERATARDGAETSSTGRNPEPRPPGFALSDLPDQSGGGGAAFVAAAAAAAAEESPRRREARREECCDTPATWDSDDSTGLGGIVPGKSDPPPTRSKSALRGWTAPRAAPGSTPL